MAAPAAPDPAASDAPEFVLLDAGAPRPGALALSFGFSSALLVLAVVLARPSSATPSARAEIISEIVMARGHSGCPQTHRPSIPTGTQRLILIRTRQPKSRIRCQVRTRRLKPPLQLTPLQWRCRSYN